MATKTDISNDEEIIIIKDNENDDAVSDSDNKSVTKKVPLKFTRDTILSMERYAKSKYILAAKLEHNKTYTTDFVDKLLESEKKRGVR